MPKQNGHLTSQEKRFAEVFAATGEVGYSSLKAGYASPAGGSNALRRPAVAGEVARVQQERLFSEILPLAVQVHADVLRDPKTPAGARVQAVKLAYDRTLGRDEAFKGRDPSDMTPDEIARAIDELRRVAADRAKPVVELEAEPVEQPAKPDLFG